MRPARIASAVCTLSLASTVYTSPCRYTVSAAAVAPAPGAAAGVAARARGAGAPAGIAAATIAAANGAAALKILDRIERCPQIRDEIARVFNTHRNADQRVRDAD